MSKGSRANTKPRPRARPSADGRPGQNEGEGSRRADRNYREGVARHIDSGRSDEAADAARRALDGEEAGELERAEGEGKRRADAAPDDGLPFNPDPD